MICKKLEIIKKNIHIWIYKNIKKQSSSVHISTKRKKNHIVGSTLLCARYVMILDGLIIIIKWNVSMELGANNYNSKTFNSSTKS